MTAAPPDTPDTPPVQTSYELLKTYTDNDIDADAYILKAYEYVVKRIRLRKTLIPMMFERAGVYSRVSDTSSRTIYETPTVNATTRAAYMIKEIDSFINTDPSDEAHVITNNSNDITIGNLYEPNYGFHVTRDTNDTVLLDNDGNPYIEEGYDITLLEKPQLYREHNFIVDTNKNNNVTFVMALGYLYPPLTISKDSYNDIMQHTETNEAQDGTYVDPLLFMLIAPTVKAFYYGEHKGDLSTQSRLLDWVSRMINTYNENWNRLANEALGTLGSVVPKEIRR